MAYSCDYVMYTDLRCILALYFYLLILRVKIPTTQELKQSSKQKAGVARSQSRRREGNCHQKAQSLLNRWMVFAMR